jgi:hypothetical protein
VIFDQTKKEDMSVIYNRWWKLLIISASTSTSGNELY